MNLDIMRCCIFQQTIKLKDDDNNDNISSIRGTRMTIISSISSGNDDNDEDFGIVLPTFFVSFSDNILF